MMPLHLAPGEVAELPRRPRPRRQKPPRPAPPLFDLLFTLFCGALVVTSVAGVILIFKGLLDV